MTSKSPVRPSMLESEGANVATALEYVIETQEFTAYIQQKRTEAIRKRDDLFTETNRLQAELQGRALRITDLDEIIARCDAALGLDLKQIGGPKDNSHE